MLTQGAYLAYAFRLVKVRGDGKAKPQGRIDCPFDIIFIKLAGQQNGKAYGQTTV